MKNLFWGSIALVVSIGSVSASAMSVDWSGNYRVEYNEINMSYLTGSPSGQAADKGNKSYFLNHLSLSPKIIALDGVNIVSNFEVFSSAQYPGSQVGSDFGEGSAMNSSTPGTIYPSANPSGDIAQGQGANMLEVNQLYLAWNHEYGEFVAGRMPIQFGLGVTHNAGIGLFDHWQETHDIVGYKFLVGNLSFMPMYGRTHRAYGFGGGGYGTEEMIDVNYTSPETESTIALFHQVRSAGPAANDSALYFAPNDIGAGGPTITGGMNTTLTSLYFAKGWEKFKLKFEATFQSGSTGAQYTNYAPNNATSGVAGSGTINLGGFGLAIELIFPRPDSKWQWNFREGIATGDNPQTQNFEGFSFNKNYNIAMLLFNHPLGQNNYDVLTNKLNRQRNAANQVLSNDRTVDEASLSNAIYFSPKLDYLMSDKWEWNNTFIYAVTQTNPSAVQTGTGNDLGIEWDTALTYKPHEKFRWINQIGLFSPGTAWKEGAAGRDANFTYGFESKAAISF